MYKFFRLFNFIYTTTYKFKGYRLPNTMDIKLYVVAFGLTFLVILDFLDILLLSKAIIL
jgi:hypothetical protein